MNIPKALFLVAMTITQVAVGSTTNKSAINQTQANVKATLAEIPDSLMEAVFTTSERLHNLKGTTTAMQGFDHSENLFSSVKKLLPELNSVALYRLSLRTKKELAAGAKNKYRYQLSLLLNDINLEFKNRRVVTPELAAESSKTEISEDLLNMCFVKHPLLQDLTMLMTEPDFKDVSKSVIRRARIQLEFEDSRETLRYCYDSMIKSAASQGDQERLKHLAYRLSEVRDLVHKKPTQVTTKPARVGSAK